MRPKTLRERRATDLIDRYFKAAAQKPEIGFSWRGAAVWVSTAIAFFALVLSIFSFWHVARHDQVSDAAARRAFWKAIDDSKESERHQEIALVRALGKVNVNELAHSALESKAGLTCSQMQGGSRGVNRLIDASGRAAEIRDNYENAVLANQYLAVSLGIKGWSAFAGKEEAVSDYWGRISMIGLHFGLTYGQFFINCSAAERKLPGARWQLSRYAKGALRSDVSRLQQLSIAVESGSTPNDVFYGELEEANDPANASFGNVGRVKAHLSSP